MTIDLIVAGGLNKKRVDRMRWVIIAQNIIEPVLPHILPRPDGVHWDRIEYYNPQIGKGVVMVFKPESPAERQVIPMRGLNPDASYEITFEDGTNPGCTKSGA